MKRLVVIIVLIAILFLSIHRKDPMISSSVWPMTEKQLELLIKTNGAFAVMQLIAVQYDQNPRLRTGCNEYTREIGRSAHAAKVSVRAVLSNKKLSFCNYGFLIGYIGAVLARPGNEGKAMRICRFVKENPSSPKHGYMECLKGVGTGTRSTDACEKVSRNNDELNICVVGVMNQLAEDSFARRDLAKLDPFDMCRIVSEKYQPQCYGSMAGMMIWSGKKTFEEALSLAQNIPIREGQIRATRIIAKISMNKKDGDLVSGCRALPKHLSTQCFISLIQGAMELGTPGKEWEDGFALCRDRSLTTDEKDTCVSFVLYQIEQVLYGKEKVNQICTTIESAFARYCHDYQKDFFSL